MDTFVLVFKTPTPSNWKNKDRDRVGRHDVTFLFTKMAAILDFDFLIYLIEKN